MSQVRRLAARVVVMLMIGLGLSASVLTAATNGRTSPNEGGDLELSLALSRRYAELFEQYRAAVVRITVPSKEDGRDIVKFWTGFFINHDGFVLTTNADQLQNVVRVSVEVGDFRYYAEVKALDLVTNLALLRVVSPPKQFGVVDIADSKESPAMGTLLLAVTCKRLEAPGPSPGMVQGYNTSYEGVPFRTIHLRVSIQDDGGEGGSPVFDLQGRFVGMMIASLPALHSSLVLPSRAVARVTDELLSAGKVIYGRMGIDAELKRDGDSDVRLQISTVDVDGPARSAGLKPEDVLLSIDGVQIRTHDDMRQAAFFARPGQTVTLRVRRAGKEIDLPLLVAELPLATPPLGQPGVPGPLPASVNIFPANPPAGQTMGNETAPTATASPEPKP